MNAVVERFAPSPTGALHLGHAFSALTVWEAATAACGTFLLRMDDLDVARCRPQFAEQIEDDLRWLGLCWPEPVLYQSTRVLVHNQVMADMNARGLTYPCYCTRGEIQAAAGAPQEGSGHGPVYPGTCRGRQPQPSDRPFTLRLNMEKAIAHLGGNAAVRALRIREIGCGPAGESGERTVDPDELLGQIGDVVLRRKDGAVAYHLAVVLDDGWQRVTHVTRGADLYSSTPLQRLLQALTGQPTPIYRHHRLIRDSSGRRLAKRDGDQSIATLRAAGASPAEVRALVGL